jgi:hypothetical protein
MARRRCEMTSAQLDRQWPHQIAVPAARTLLGEYHAALAFCAGMSLAPRGHSVVHNDIHYNVWCFAEAEHAARFKSRYDGIDFNPKDRGRGRNWHIWKRPG